MSDVFEDKQGSKCGWMERSRRRVEGDGFQAAKGEGTGQGCVGDRKNFVNEVRS